MYIELGFATREAILVATAIERSFVHKIEEGVSLDRSQMDPAEEIRHSKKQRENCNMLWFVQDSQYGIPRRCACGGKIIDEVRGKEDYDSQPGKRYFTCINYEDDRLHYSHPWVVGVQEEIERMRKRLEDAEEEIKGVWNLKFQIQTLQEQFRSLTVQVATLEKVSMSRVAVSFAGSRVHMSGSRVAMSVAGINKYVVALFVRDQCSLLYVSTLMLLYDE
ncbi:hypothetical protein IGI04_036525, partial [Brassica rapa subsp. trilocularis]